MSPNANIARIAVALLTCQLAFTQERLFAAEEAWCPVTLTNPELRAKGTTTGDGCQWVRALAIDPVDGNFLLWCTDVGGLFRSLDGGKTWEPANVGFDSRGSAGVAIDPHNPRRAVVVAANSVPNIHNGIYLTTDQAASWKHVLPVKMSATRDMRRQVAYDPSTFDAKAGITRTIYWSTLSVDPAHNPAWGETQKQPAFYKSEDGGETWKKIPGGELVADAVLAVHPTKGFVYAATPSGLMVSHDGGASWTTTLAGKITGLSVSAASPDSVWVTLPDGIMQSTDSGANFARLQSSDKLRQDKSALRDIAVAPSDASRMMVWRQGPSYDWVRFYSHDGGQTWAASQIIKDRVAVPTNQRQGIFSFHPKNPDIILAPGGDYPMLSLDGGRTFALAGNGVNNIMAGGALQFSSVNPDVIFFGSQDYATFLSVDGGSNWKYLEPGHKGWGGYNYAAYASSPDALVVGEAESWGAPRHIAVSRDQGKTWTISKETFTATSSYGDPKNPNILFAGPWRSQDAGISWSKMDGAEVVYTHDPTTGDVYGVKKSGDLSAVVKSGDGGKSWIEVLQHGGGIADISIDPSRQRIYFVSGGKLLAWESGKTEEISGFVPDQDGAPHVRSVSVDPINPDIVYMAGNRNEFASNASAQRSLDAGKTWTNLARTQPLDGIGRDGGRESMWVRVHPKTREAWFATNCYGIWKHAPPPK